MATLSITTSTAAPTPPRRIALAECPRCSRHFDAVDVVPCRCCRTELCPDCLGDDRLGWCLSCVGVLGKSTDGRVPARFPLSPYGIDADVTDADLVTKARCDIEDTSDGGGFTPYARALIQTLCERLERSGGPIHG